MTPTIEEQRQQFEAWFHSPGHQAYMAAVAARGGIPLDDPEKAFELYRLRWTKPRPAYWPPINNNEENNR